MISLMLSGKIRPHVLGLIVLLLAQDWPSIPAIRACTYSLSETGNSIFLAHFALSSSFYRDYMSKVQRWLPRHSNLRTAKLQSRTVGPALRREAPAISLAALPLIKETIAILRDNHIICFIFSGAHQTSGYLCMSYKKERY